MKPDFRNLLARRLRHSLIPTLLSPITLLSALWLKWVRQQGPAKIAERIFMRVGIWPVLDHYYQPLINPRRHLRYSLQSDRCLPGIDLDVPGQLALLDRFHYNDELLRLPLDAPSPDETSTGRPEYYYNNGSYEAGDSEYLYNLLRHFKPRRLFEIGSGFSSLMARHAIECNSREDPAYACRHVCIEPYEKPWLERIGAEIMRQRVECLGRAFFGQLQRGDVLFIDSSHVIRPQGDVLFEILEILPTLEPGVLVHLHDIFTPRDYPESWIVDAHLLWNEQYLLEAFLSLNSAFRVVGALNHLAHHHFDRLAARCPVLARQSHRRPAAFWIERVR